ncbi:MAG: phosphoribosylaminoimidazolesuccinocarboxamide synthase [Proteobacteria bacterium]|nr:phosphoribosylaminoimidazolesuccinocarboxamide synthase [Pseudomonadota bacterium]
MKKENQPMIQSLSLIHQGKVRDIYDIDDKTMLIVTTDRLSAFDVILPSPIDGKGIILTEVANFWFNKLSHIIPNQLSNKKVEDLGLTQQEQAYLHGRAIVVKKLKPLPIEAIVRGYIIGSGWKDYQRTGKVCGIELPEGLQMAGQLAQPLFTPSSKAGKGEHDANISFEEMQDLLGESLAEQVKQASLDLYQQAAAYALEKGIIIADTKFEFGLDENDQLILIDEVLTPDSSRFWSVKTYKPGISPPSFDKQIVRDYLETLDWDKTPPGPVLPAEIVQQTTGRYREVADLLINT